MPIRADFEIVRFYEHLGDNINDLSASERGSTTWQGDESTEKVFNIDGTPTGHAYLIIGTRGVDGWGHEVLINGTKAGNLVPSKGWQTQMLQVKSPAKLKKGDNTIQIVRDKTKTDNFLIDRAVIHWRESD